MSSVGLDGHYGRGGRQALPQDIQFHKTASADITIVDYAKA